jgi:hypothetical protein
MSADNGSLSVDLRAIARPATGDAMWLKFVLAVGLAGFTCPSLATIYKWIDDRGVTHYAQAPPEGRKAQTIAIPTAAAPSSAESVNAPLRDAESGVHRVGIADIRLRRGSRERATVAEQVHTCVRAQWNLRALDTPRPRFFYENGAERVRTRTWNRDEERLRLLHIMDQTCDPRWQLRLEG